MDVFDFFKKDDLTKEIERHEVKNIDPRKDEASIEKIFKEVFNKTKKDFISITLTNSKPSIFESKVGGLGYIPHDSDFPTTSDGEQLRLLAQIECSKIDLTEFPKHGLLQFWILNDDVYGADFDNMKNNATQNTFRIIYHENIDLTVTEEEVTSKFKENQYDKDGYMPCFGEYSLSFNKKFAGMLECDGRYEKLFCSRFNVAYPDTPIENIYDLEISFDEMDCYEKLTEISFGHKIGGYPAFTQWDPREENDTHDFLLLQLDSDYGNGNDRIMWGDSGVANFFISSDKLKNLDFSDVIYNWDCY